MKEYVEFFCQVVAQFDANSRPDAKSPGKQAVRTAVGLPEGVGGPGQLWGYAIIQFSRRMLKYETQMKSKGGLPVEKAGLVV